MFTLSTLMKIFMYFVVFSLFSHVFASSTFQYSTFGALMRGGFEGELLAKDLENYGDFGLGTFNNIDGELVAYDGKFYQIELSGKLTLVNNAIKTPFANVVFFKPNADFKITKIKNYKSLGKKIGKILKNKNIPYAIAIEGVFKKLHLRSLKSQTKPFKNLKEASKEQNEYYMENVEGVLIGFWYPMYFSGITVPHYHFHFVNKERTKGGHVLNASITSAMARFMSIEEFNLKLPITKEFSNLNLEGNQTEDIRQVESR